MSTLSRNSLSRNCLLSPEALASIEEQRKIADIRASLNPAFLASLGYSLETHPDLLGDVRILRCIRAFPSLECKRRFHDSLRMRKILGVDEVRADALKIIEKKGLYGWDVEDLAYGRESRMYLPDICFNAGKTASGAPFFTQTLATSNYDGFLTAFGYKAFLSFLTSYLELRQLQLARVSETRYIRQIIIMTIGSNLQFLSRKIIAFVRSTEAKQLFACYQELTFTNYFIDSPWVFQAAFNSINPFLPVHIQKKIHFMSKAALENHCTLSREVRVWLGLEPPSVEPSDHLPNPYGCTLTFWQDLQLRPDTLPLVTEAVNVARVAVLLFDQDLGDGARRVLKHSVLDPGASTNQELEEGCRELIYLEDVILEKPFTVQTLLNGRRFLDNFLHKWKNRPDSVKTRGVKVLDLDSPAVNQWCIPTLPALPHVPNFITQWIPTHSS
eukprot:GEMP01039565.1.p1 GENE.GEMP01039565.1~~GEMP01039565.1.p1  ORF type:complete len:442 (+),score=72.44 GEMP01039565.1:48-1373(+)